MCLLLSQEGTEEDSEEDVGHEDSGEEEWQQALTVGGLGSSMSKGELASLIHQGAKAILQTEVWVNRMNTCTRYAIIYYFVAVTLLRVNAMRVDSYCTYETRWL